MRRVIRVNKYVLHNTAAAGDNNAGSKAGRDAVTIAEKSGYRFVPLYKARGVHTTVGNVLEGYIHTRRLCRKLHAGDIVFLQYPINRFLLKRIYRMLKKKGVHTITLIHDIDYLRNVALGDRGVEGMRELELSLLQNTDCLICHNEAMIRTLKKENLAVRFISLELFDYLYDGAPAKNTHDDTVIVAGNLSPQKAGYLYKLHNHSFPLSLYGNNLDKLDDPQAEYMGSFPPDELIAHLKGAFGLVWDGDDVSSCSGAYGKYLRLNNPHKVSLYLAAGLPIIVWKQSALYPFVKANGVGVGVESLEEIAEKIASHNYEELRNNVDLLSKKVRSGFFLRKALHEAEEDICCKTL